MNEISDSIEKSQCPCHLIRSPSRSRPLEREKRRNGLFYILVSNSISDSSESRGGFLDRRVFYHMTPKRFIDEKKDT